MKNSMSFHMIDVGEKAVTRRRAIARGLFWAQEETLRRIWAGALPKGDVLKMAETAGIMAAKRTPDLLPLCHPLSLDSVRISFSESRLDETEQAAIEVHCEVICHGKTGVEMEALAGVQVALLCIYDLVKGIDPVLEISGIRLLEKHGGKSGHWFHPRHLASEPTTAMKSVSERDHLAFAGITVGILTVSDRCSRGDAEDLTGPRIEEVFRKEGATIAARRIVPDQVEEIRGVLRQWASKNQSDKQIHVAILTGGTGIAPRDVTPEALRPLWDRTIPGFGELFRQKGAENTKMAWLSRAEAGLIGNLLVFALPGSRGGVEDGLAVFRQILPHAFHILQGGSH